MGALLCDAIVRHSEETILCVCYTNHALDQFLEALLAKGIKDIVRIGGRSNSQVRRGPVPPAARRPRAPRMLLTRRMAFLPVSYGAYPECAVECTLRNAQALAPYNLWELAKSNDPNRQRLSTTEVRRLKTLKEEAASLDVKVRVARVEKLLLLWAGQVGAQISCRCMWCVWVKCNALWHVLGCAVTLLWPHNDMTYWRLPLCVPQCRSVA